MAVTASQQIEVDSPVGVAFAYVDDWRNVPDWLVGVERFTPAGERDQGLGSVFDVVVHAGVKVKTRLEVTGYEVERLIEFESRQGFKVRSRWRFEPLGEARSVLTCETELHPPFGPAGKAMAKVLEPATRKLVGRSAERLKGRIEGV